MNAAHRSAMGSPGIPPDPVSGAAAGELVVGTQEALELFGELVAAGE